MGTRQGSFADFVLDQLSGLEGVSARRMFGGHGLYLGESFFGIIHDGRVYFRTDAASRTDYERAGMQPFSPNTKQVLKNYLEVPVEVIEQPGRLREWALRAVAAQTLPGGRGHRP